jgi:pimeloyl-ACP methyl ester carboxylesterase
MSQLVMFFGGNGHSAARLGPALAVLEGWQPRGFRLVDACYPGFDGRPRAADFEDFIARIGDRVAEVAGPDLLYGTGIGGLLLLCLRSRGLALQCPLLLQAPVLWGLERRWMPRLLRICPLSRILRPLFASPRYQRRFVGKHFERPLDEPTQRAFFDGYARCSALADFFDWLTPALLRDLEARFHDCPAALERITVWWGGRDRVVTPLELSLTEQALGVRWPLRELPEWGHYPMIEQPREWVTAVAEALGEHG